MPLKTNKQAKPKTFFSYASSLATVLLYLLPHHETFQKSFLLYFFTFYFLFIPLQYGFGFHLCTETVLETFPSLLINPVHLFNFHPACLTAFNQSITLWNIFFPLLLWCHTLIFLLSCDCSFLILSVFIFLSFRIPQGSHLSFSSILSLIKFWWNWGFNLIMEILMKPKCFFKKSNDLFYENDLCLSQYIFKHHGKVQRCKKKLSQILPPRNKQC